MNSQSGNSRNDPAVKKKGIINEDVIKPNGSLKMEDLFGYIKPQVERIARKQYGNEQTPQLMGTKWN
jgi:hypothetical protein